MRCIFYGMLNHFVLNRFEKIDKTLSSALCIMGHIFDQYEPEVHSTNFNIEPSIPNFI